MADLMVYTAVQLEHEERRTYTSANAIVLGNYTDEAAAARACVAEAETTSDGYEYDAIRRLETPWQTGIPRRDICQLMSEGWEENAGDDGEPDDADTIYTFSIWSRPLED